LALTLLLVSCSRSPDRLTGTERATGTAAAPLPQADVPSSVQAKLGAVRGSYKWNEDTKRYLFSDKQAIEGIVGAATDQIVRDLVNCLDDRRPAQATLKGERVSVGIVCYEALTQIVYYEPPARNGDIASTWSGHIEPTATGDQLAEAKRAWNDVIDKKAYKRL
jgi:hypothetical protein